jgi:hypothetical protein
MSNSDFRIKKKSPKVGPSLTESKSKSPPGHSSDAIGQIKAQGKGISSAAVQAYFDK